MTENMKKIDHLKKVTLALECSAGIKGASEKQFPLMFIYGIGPGGFTPFEYALAGKGEGDEFSIRVENMDIPNYFEHLAHAFTDCGTGDLFYLRGRVVKITAADQREVITAMAELADCGDHCRGH
jgi:hypothetical protein